jgi:hypothetical protein
MLSHIKEKVDDTDTRMEKKPQKIFVSTGCSKWEIQILSSQGSKTFRTIYI